MNLVISTEDGAIIVESDDVVSPQGDGGSGPAALVRLLGGGGGRTLRLRLRCSAAAVVVVVRARREADVWRFVIWRFVIWRFVEPWSVGRPMTLA